MRQTEALIVERTVLGPGYYYYRLLCPEIAELAKPGQFIEIKVSSEGTLDPLLSRPISIYRIDRKEGSLAVIFKTVGRGTRRIAELKMGNQISIFGPVGNGFTLPEETGRIALIAGGIGMPPLFSLAEHYPERDFTLFYGGRSAGDLLGLEAWEKLGVPYRLATDDGSAGFHGLVTALFEKEYEARPFDYMIACGPKPMLRAVQQLAAKYRLPGALSLEAYMACGVGACLGCTCVTTKGYKRVCVDGPVFDISEVAFDE